MAVDDKYECDVLVIGSGASGMSAAVTAAKHGLKVLIVEKEPKFGGTTARSGGWLWIPGTSLAKAWGINESPDLARTYLRHETGNSFDSERVDAFIENGPKAVDFFLANTALRFDMPLVLKHPAPQTSISLSSPTDGWSPKIPSVRHGTT